VNTELVSANCLPKHFAAGASSARVKFIDGGKARPAEELRAAFSAATRLSFVLIGDML
jgi:hypothetical protein